MLFFHDKDPLKRYYSGRSVDSQKKSKERRRQRVALILDSNAVPQGFLIHAEQGVEECNLEASGAF